MAGAPGIGWGLNEEYVYDDQGRLLNASLLDYRMPTCLDLPMIETVLVEVARSRASIRGARGRRDADRAAPAALANAIYRAVGCVCMSCRCRRPDPGSHPGKREQIMAMVWVPGLLREMTGGLERVEVPGESVGEVIDALDAKYPVLKRD